MPRETPGYHGAYLRVDLTTGSSERIALDAGLLRDYLGGSGLGFVAKPNRGHGNVTGADNVVSWRTGYPFGVNHARAYPRFNPGEYTTADVLARGEADCGMTIACDPMANFSQPAREHLATIPYIALDAKETPTTRAAAVAFTVATYGINTGGTVYRMDDVPIPLRPAFASPPPSDYDVLTAIEERVKKIMGVTG